MRTGACTSAGGGRCALLTEAAQQHCLSSCGAHACFIILIKVAEAVECVGRAMRTDACTSAGGGRCALLTDAVQQDSLSSR